MDIDEEELVETGKKCSEILGGNNVLTVLTDVSKLDQVVKLRDRVYEAWGEVMLFSSFSNTFSSCILLYLFYSLRAIRLCLLEVPVNYTLISKCFVDRSFSFCRQG